MLFGSGSGCRSIVYIVRSVLTLASLILLSGCGKGFPSGHYEGTYSHFKDLKYVHDSVGIDVDTKRKPALIVAKSIDGEVVSTLEVFLLNSNTFELKLPEIGSELFHFIRNGNCFKGSSLQSLKVYSAEFCSDRGDFTLRVNSDGLPVLTLTASAFSKEKRIEYEIPTTLSVSDLVQRALQSNFETRMEYEKVLRAKKAVQSAYLSLLPRVNLGTVAWNITMSPISLGTTMAASVGDFAPFLLPSRWIQAKKTSVNALIEEIARILMRADLATQVEGLAYVYQRDLNIFRFQKDFVERVSKYYEQVKELESKSKLQLGAHKYVQMELNSLNMSLIALETLLRADRYAISQSLGFINPEAVQDVIFASEEIPIELATLESRQSLADIAIGRSFELKQIDEAIRLAQYEKSELYVSWMDPQGDPTRNLGFALIPQFQIAKSKLNELQIKREQVRSLVAQKAFEISDVSEEAIRTYPLARDVLNQSMEFLKKSVQSTLNTYEFDGEDLQSKLDTVASSYARMETAMASFRVARAKIDRLKLQGYYLQLMPNCEESEKSPVKLEKHNGYVRLE